MHWREAGPGEKMRYAVIGEPPDFELQAVAFAAAFRAMDVDAEFIPLECAREPRCIP